MKNLLKAALLFTFVCLGSYSYAQEIAIDDVGANGEKVTKTTWEYFALTGKLGGTLQFVDKGGQKSIGLKMVLYPPGKVFTIDNNQLMLIKLEDGSVITLHSDAFSVTCHGCASKGLAFSDAHGLENSYQISQEDFDKLAKSPIVKIRIETSEGNVDQILSAKHSKKLLAAAKLLVN